MRRLVNFLPLFALIRATAALLAATAAMRSSSMESEGWDPRSAFVESVRRGERPLEARRAGNLLRLELDLQRAEAERRAGIIPLLLGAAAFAMAGGIAQLASARAERQATRPEAA